MHVSLQGDLMMGMQMMKYSVNHWWKFDSERLAFRAGLLQFLSIIWLEFANMFVLIKATDIFDIIKDFIAFMIIAEFDDILF